MKIAVTAASGGLGGAITSELVNQIGSGNVVALARTPANVTIEGVEVRAGDYNSYEQFNEALNDIERILLVSGMDHPDKRIGQHRNVINAAKNAGVKKIVYTSIMGDSSGNSFSPVVASNRQTEKDVKDSGMNWAIGRNGIYIEPDIEYIEHYRKAGKIANCAGEGKCAYTTRGELAYAYSQMLLEDDHNGITYNLGGEAITQQQLTEYMNMSFGTDLAYEAMSVEDYRQERIAELGEFLGTIIAGIYQGIREGTFDKISDFSKAAGREHISWDTYFRKLKNI